MSTQPPKPDMAVMRRVEELLREQMAELGDDPDLLSPHEISANMTCGVHAGGSLSYAWKGTPILDVDPELMPDGSIRWRFFTREAPVQ